MKPKKSWKDSLGVLCDNLPLVGIDPKPYLKAMSKLPVEPITSETYKNTSPSSSTIKVGLGFLYRDLMVIKNAAAQSPEWVKLQEQVDALLPLVKDADKRFMKWDRESYPHSIKRKESK